LITQELRAVLLRNRSLKPSIFTFLKYWVKLKTQLSFMIKLDFFLLYLQFESNFIIQKIRKRLMKLRTEEKKLTVRKTCLRLVNEAQSRNMFKQLHQQMKFPLLFQPFKKRCTQLPHPPLSYFLHFKHTELWGHLLAKWKK
jgi:hypothetical protein